MVRVASGRDARQRRLRLRHHVRVAISESRVTGVTALRSRCRVTACVPCKSPPASPSAFPLPRCLGAGLARLGVAAPHGRCGPGPSCSPAPAPPARYWARPRPSQDASQHATAPALAGLRRHRHDAVARPGFSGSPHGPDPHAATLPHSRRGASGPPVGAAASSRFAPEVSLTRGAAGARASGADDAGRNPGAGVRRVQWRDDSDAPT